MLDVVRAVVCLTGLLVVAPALAQGPRPLKAIMNLNIDGSNAAFALARERGYYKAAGLEVTIDSSRGSGDAIAKVASGAYEVGYADISTLVDFWGKNPASAPKTVMLLQDRSPQVVASLRKAGIAKPQDLVGRSVGATTTDAASRMFPAFARLAGLDLDRVKRQTVDVRIRDAMLLRGDVDAVLGFDLTTVINLTSQGIKAEDVSLIYFADYGLDFYGNGIIASRALIEQSPDTVRAFVAAAARGWREAIAEPAAAVDAIAARDPLVNKAAELARLRWVIDHHLVTPRTRAGGLGVADAARLESNLRLVAEAFELGKVPAVAEIYDDRFLPPLEARRIPD
jgi:NitT/TauT family transport system substrate-binding protein